MDGIIGSIYRTNERNIKDGAYTLSRDCCTEDIVIPYMIAHVDIV